MFNLFKLSPTQTILDILKPANEIEITPLDVNTDTTEDGTVILTADTSKITPDVNIEVSDSDATVTIQEETATHFVEHSLSFPVDNIDKENVSADFDEDGKLVVTLPTTGTGNENKEEKKPSIAINRI